MVSTAVISGRATRALQPKKAESSIFVKALSLGNSVKEAQFSNAWLPNVWMPVHSGNVNSEAQPEKA